MIACRAIGRPFCFPAFALLAAYGAEDIWTGEIARRIVSVSRALAIPIAALILALVYGQAFFGVVPKRDPIGRLTAFGMKPVVAELEQASRREGAKGIVTTSYATTSWLAFYLKPKMPVVQVNENFRWLSAPEADPALAAAPLLFVTTGGEKTMPAIAAHFSQIDHIGEVDRRRKGVLIEKYDLYRVSGFRGGALGRLVSPPSP
jgi:hypothetical protein